MGSGTGPTKRAEMVGGATVVEPSDTIIRLTYEAHSHDLMATPRTGMDGGGISALKP